MRQPRNGLVQCLPIVCISSTVAYPSQIGDPIAEIVALVHVSEEGENDDIAVYL